MCKHELLPLLLLLGLLHLLPQQVRKRELLQRGFDTLQNVRSSEDILPLLLLLFLLQDQERELLQCLDTLQDRPYASSAAATAAVAAGPRA
jgi:hypothetical protein